uniref:Uncharacterized protein n=1 Tax=Symphyocladiella dendroidea TaxID=2506487 RepID=A0A1Z1M778_9FLOR|nr:hypothetical protein [Symphyocladiella dendroidea]ARW61947.1 hypothetical protein [Symphyocladiella dendroidea]
MKELCYIFFSLKVFKILNSNNFKSNTTTTTNTFDKSSSFSILSNNYILIVSHLEYTQFYFFAIYFYYIKNIQNRSKLYIRKKADKLSKK